MIIFQLFMLLLLAAVPAVGLIFYIYILTKKRKVSIPLMALLGVLGGVSTIPAIVFEALGDKWITGMHFSDDVAFVIDCFLVVAVVEELGKYLFLVLITWWQKDFKYSYNGIVYAVCVSLGFALVENILYVFLGGAGVGILRAFSAVPMHCALAVFMGFLYGKAREAAREKNTEKCIGFMMLAYLVPVLLHGLYDLVAVVQLGDENEWLVFSLVALAIFFMAEMIVKYASKRNHRIDGQPDLTDLMTVKNVVTPYYNQTFPYGGFQNYSQPVLYGNAQNYGQPVAYGNTQVYSQPGAYSNAQYYSQPGAYSNAQYYSQPVTYGNAQGYSQPVQSGSGQYYGNPLQYELERYYGQSMCNYSQPELYGNMQNYNQSEPYDNMQNGDVQSYNNLAESYIAAGYQGYPEYQMYWESQVYSRYQQNLPENFYAPGKDSSGN